MMQQKKYIVSARFLVNPETAVIEQGGLLYSSGRIIAVDSLTALKRSFPGVEIAHYDDSAIVPLLVNAHTHLELTEFPLWAEQKGYQVDDPVGFIDWILKLIQVKSKLDQEKYHKAITKGIEQSLMAGTGVVGDILAHHSVRSAYEGVSLGGVVFLETLGQDPAMIRRLKKGLYKALEEPFSSDAVIGLSPHSPYTISNYYLRHVFDLCRRRGLRCCTHIAESEEELKFIKYSRGAIAERFYPAINWHAFVPAAAGMRPVAYLDQQGGLFPENLLVHGVHLNDADIDLLARRRMSLALCPRSNARLKVGRAPAARLRNAGVRLALGTDSLASNDSLSVWDEMSFAATWFAGEIDAPTIFAMATQQGADALGLGEEYGSLSPGKRAGFQIIKCSDIGIGELYEYFCSGIGQNDIMQIYRDGRPHKSGV